MKSTTVLLPLAFASTLLLSARMPGDTLAFAPATGADVTKSFEMQGSLTLDDVSMVFNGEEQDPSMMGLPSDLAVDFGIEVGITDTFTAMKDGMVTDLTRTFDSMRVWSESTDGESTDDEMEELAGKKARFVWDEEEGKYNRTVVDDEESDPEDLDMVAIDMDLRALLPDGEVEAGDSWDISGFQVFSILFPGIDMEVALEENSDEMFEDAPAGMEEEVLAALEGVTATCTYAGTSEVDGTNLAVIEFVCKIDQATSLGPEALDEGIEDGGFEIAFELEIEGECTWDVAAGHFASFDTEGLGSVSVLMSIGSEMADIEASGELSIDLKHSYRAGIQ